MKRSSFLASIIAAITALFGFKKKPEKWTKFGEHYGDVIHPSWKDMGTVEFGPKISVTTIQDGQWGYKNETHHFIIDTHKIEVSYYDIEKRKLIIRESNDNGNTWEIIEEIDGKNIIA